MTLISVWRVHGEGAERNGTCAAPLEVWNILLAPIILPVISYALQGNRVRPTTSRADSERTACAKSVALKSLKSTKSMSDRSTPQKDGFFAPAEWAPHSHCIVGWPWRQEIWPCKGGPVHKV